MKLEPIYSPNLPKDLKESKLISTYSDIREFPTIQMKMATGKYTGLVATVTFNFTHREYKGKVFKKIFIGPAQEVYKVAVRQSSKIGLNLERQFNTEWNRTQSNLLNEPSKNKSILNLGIYKKDSYGLYDITDPSVLLDQKIIESGLSLKDFANQSEVNETTLFRHLKGTFEISREVAIKYARTLGCDPAEILFNSLNIPVWGSTNTQDMRMVNKYSVYASEITATTKISSVKVPREIYRPDIKAIVIDTPNSVYHGHTAFYYNSNAPIVFENQIVIVGTKSIKNFSDAEHRMRYFIGVYKKNKNGRTVDLHTIDTDNIDLSLIEPDIDTYSFDDFIDVEKSQKIIIDDIVPEFVAPVVALVNDPKINDKIKIDINKKFQSVHTKNRTEDFKSIQHFKDLKNAETTLEEIKKNAAIGAELIKQMELSKRDVQKNIDEAIQKIQDLEEPDITPEEAAK